MADANPIFDLGNPIWIQVIAVAETPPQNVAYGGRFLSVPTATVLPPLGTRGIVQVSGVQVSGYLRQNAGAYEWVMMPLVDPVIATVDGLPGPQGWTSLPSRATWRSIADALRGLGVSQPDLATGLGQLYGAARTNVLAEHGIS